MHETENTAFISIVTPFILPSFISEGRQHKFLEVLYKDEFELFCQPHVSFFNCDLHYHSITLSSQLHLIRSCYPV